MENPFFRNCVKSSSRPRFYDTTTTARTPPPRGIPVVRQPTTTTTKSPKVVSIPVHFVGSEATRSNAARRIQKVFRGYRVRKNVKRIVGIKKQVDEIEKKISHKETIDLVRNDAKERLKVNETLMALLFKLDSVGGFDSGVRECRRAVIKKAIMLQERLDAIVSEDIQTLVVGGGNDDQEDKDISDSITEQGKTLGRGSEDEVKEDLKGVEQSRQDNFVQRCNSVEIEEKGAAEAVSVVEAECSKESPSGKDQSSHVEVETVEKKLQGEEEDPMEIEHQQPDLIQGNEEEGTENKVPEEDESLLAHDGKQQLMVKMIEKNEMLIGMVAELCERNTMQSQLINSLSKRVDSLEKALSKCKKRRKVAPRKGNLQQ